MGVIEGVKHKYILYASDGWEMCSVIPLNDDLYNLGNLAGMYYRNIFKGNVSKKELEKLKKRYVEEDFDKSSFGDMQENYKVIHSTK